MESIISYNVLLFMFLAVIVSFIMLQLKYNKRKNKYRDKKDRLYDVSLRLNKLLSTVLVYETNKIIQSFDIKPDGATIEILLSENVGYLQKEFNLTNLEWYKLCHECVDSTF